MRLVGRIQVHPRGFGFVVDGDASAFVAPPDLNQFLTDDRVACDVEERGERRTARSLKLLERRRTRLFGEVVRKGGATLLRVDRTVSNTDWPLEGSTDPDGARVLARIDGAKAVREESFAGKEAELTAVLTRHDLKGAHEQALIEMAASAPPLSLEGRRDLRSLVCVTIDGPSTRDIDDALLAYPPDDDGAVRVIVAIADVGAVVDDKSPLDLDARARATSVYLPGRTMPMFPRALSEDRLTLSEGDERGVLTAELRVDPEGRVTSLDVHEAVIRSTARLTYNAVAKFLEEGDETAVPASTHATLRLLRTAASRLSQARSERGGKDVEREEISVKLDEEGDPIGVETRTNNVAHVIVERLMVAANEAIARFLVERGLPGVYRVHEAPTLERTQALAEASEALGVVAGFSRTTPLSPKALAAFDRQIHGTRHEGAIESAMRRLLGPARYTTTPGPHFGLAAPLYLHFTSPIRRYADLMVHRILRRYLRGERTVSSDGMEEICEHLNEQSRRAARAESDRERVLLARLFASRVGQKYVGVVVGNKPQGALVQVDGAVAVLAGEAQPLGHALNVVVTGVDEELGRIDVKLA